VSPDQSATRRVAVNALSTTYVEAGDPQAPPVVLLHDGAFGSNAGLCWETVIPLLSDRYRLIAPDLLGFGGSAKVFAFDADPLNQRIRHIAALCDVLQLDRPAFVGASFGGGMVLRGAADGTLAMHAGVSISGPGGLHMIPERFARLQDYEPSEQAAREIAEQFAISVTGEVARRRFESSMTPGHWETLSAARLRNPAAEPATGDFRPAYRKALAGIDVPILLVAGAQDPLLEPGWAGAMAELIPRARAEEVAAGRHLPHLDEPAAVAGLIRTFLEQA
jgi:pimeloyl-ACP methyl ester carboxylesterase